MKVKNHRSAQGGDIAMKEERAMEKGLLAGSTCSGLDPALNSLKAVVSRSGSGRVYTVVIPRRNGQRVSVVERLAEGSIATLDNEEERERVKSVTIDEQINKETSMSSLRKAHSTWLLIVMMIMSLGLMFSTVFGIVGCGDDDDDDDDPIPTPTPTPFIYDHTDTCGGTIRCTNGVCQVEGVFCDNIMFYDENLYILNGGVFIGNDNPSTTNTLTIEAGTEIHGLKTTPPGMLVITRHAEINAVGTADAPIVFTSDLPVGQRARKDWGGIIINGLAQINTCATPPCEAQGEGGSGLYGGSDDADSSGTMKYVRIEYAGHDFTSEDELNGLALQGVGSGTTLEYIQIHMNKDDGIEFFGGNAHVKHLLLTGHADDSLDWTFGWRGKAQFVVIQQYEDDADNGIEADNNGDTDQNALPRSQPMLSNLTMIGSPNSSASDAGTLLRKGTGANIFSSIITGFNEVGLDIDDTATWVNAYTDDTYSQLSGELSIADCIFYNAANFSDDGDVQAESVFFAHNNADSRYGNNSTSDPNLIDPYNQANPNFMPTSKIPNTIDPHTMDPWFTSTNFIGAFDPTGANWMAGWTTSAQN